MLVCLPAPLRQRERRHQLQLMKIQSMHAVDLLSGLLIVALAGQNVMIQHSVGKADLILI